MPLQVLAGGTDIPISIPRGRTCPSYHNAFNHYNRLKQRLYPGGSIVYRRYHTAYSVSLFTVHFFMTYYFLGTSTTCLVAKEQKKKQNQNNYAETIKRSSDCLTCSPVLLCPKRVQYVRLYMPVHICSSFTCSYFLEIAGDSHLVQSRFH